MENPSFSVQSFCIVKSNQISGHEVNEMTFITFVVMLICLFVSMKTRYGGGPELVYNVINEEGEGTIEPAPCFDCIKRKEEKEYLERLNFENGTLYITIELDPSNPRYRTKSKRLMRN
jgi:hypothetical protein